MTKIEKLVLAEISKTKWIHGSVIINGIYFEAKIKLDELTFRNIIKSLRNQGEQIIASSKGYKLAKNKDELEAYYISRIRELNDERRTLIKMTEGVL